MEVNTNIQPNPYWKWYIIVIWNFRIDQMA